MVVEFEFETEFGLFKDALHFADDSLPSEKEIEAMKVARRDNWVAAVKAASESTDPPIEE